LKLTSFSSSLKVIFQLFNAITEMFGHERLSKIWAGFVPIVLLFQPEAIEHLLSNTANTQKSDHYRFLQPWLGLGLVTSNNAKWKQRRKMLTPTFHFRILQDFMPVFNEHANLLLDQLDQLTIESEPEQRSTNALHAICRKCSIKRMKLNQESSESSGRDAIVGDGFVCRCPSVNRPLSLSKNRATDDDKIESVDIVPILTRCTLNVICETAMGIRLHEKQSTKEEEYVQCLHQVSQLIIWRITRPWFWNDWMFRFTPECRRFHKCLTVMKTFTRDVIRQRRDDWQQRLTNTCPDRPSDPSRRLVFLDLLLQHHFQSPTAFTTEDIREEVDTFMFAVSPSPVFLSFTRPKLI
jgi:cytochrome P450